ncbi:hypothetical protein [Specibacter cremeus]|uniref:hypothetical protein n=1 Tax=Specibacter cremeus TaxID=1629051 RepID=UPI0013DE6361|nr:hypothetical protein [Specibacter cremeus]
MTAENNAEIADFTRADLRCLVRADDLLVKSWLRDAWTLSTGADSGTLVKEAGA